jgi:hypothetical protein
MAYFLAYVSVEFTIKGFPGMICINAYLVNSAVGTCYLVLI